MIDPYTISESLLAGLTIIGQTLIDGLRALKHETMKRVERGDCNKGYDSDSSNESEDSVRST